MPFMTVAGCNALLQAMQQSITPAKIKGLFINKIDICIRSEVKEYACLMLEENQFDSAFLFIVITRTFKRLNINGCSTSVIRIHIEFFEN